MLDGKKTYILVGLALVGALTTYLSHVISTGFNLAEFWTFIQSEAVLGALATLRLAIAKKV